MNKGVNVNGAAIGFKRGFDVFVVQMASLCVKRYRFNSDDCSIVNDRKFDHSQIMSFEC